LGTISASRIGTTFFAFGRVLRTGSPRRFWEVSVRLLVPFPPDALVLAIPVKTDTLQASIERADGIMPLLLVVVR
jgi:hypothetical protein